MSFPKAAGTTDTNSRRRLMTPAISSLPNGESSAPAVACDASGVQHPRNLVFLFARVAAHGAFDYDPKSDADDERGFKFDKHSFVPGEYVSITEHDHVQRTFRIASVLDLD